MINGACFIVVARLSFRVPILGEQVGNQASLPEWCRSIGVMACAK